jgi:aconitate hydratase 2/2-methylisocitrate dehydratase
MDLYRTYLTEIENRKSEGLQPKPIDDGKLLNELITHIKNPTSNERDNCIDFLIYNTLPGTTSAAGGSSSGLAFRILEAGYRLNISRMFACLLLLAVIGVLFHKLIEITAQMALSRYN